MRSIAAPDRAAISASIIAQFRASMRELKCIGGERMRRTGLNLTHSHILAMLDRHGHMPISRLAESLDVSLSNASGIVARLEDHGLVERVRVPDDRRVVLVRPTEAGKATLARLDVLRDELIQGILGRLDERQLRRVAAALEDIRLAAAETFAGDPELSRHEHLHHHDVAHPPHA